MYQIFIDFKVGDYLKDNTGRIYELTKVSVSIEFNVQTKRDTPRVLLQGVDAREPWGKFFILQYHQVVKARKEEVDNYVLSEEKVNNFDISRTVMTKPYEKKHQKVEKQKEVKVLSLDEILDETLRYERLIETLGDEDGLYKKKIESLKNDFIALSATIS